MFELLTSEIVPLVIYLNTKMSKAITLGELLALTLQVLATGIVIQMASDTLMSGLCHLPCDVHIVCSGKGEC